MRTSSVRRAAGAACAALALLTASCSGDDGTKTVTATDYAFEDLPESVDAGTTLTLRNASDKELHELVAIWLPDDEKRSVQQLVNLPPAEQQAIFGRGQPAMVLIAPPGGDDPIKVLGDGRLTEKGRYAVVCMIPTGANPAAYLAAAQAASGAAPPQVAGGPPHVTQGMYGEITVE
jgi:plastocyanin